MSTFIVPDYIHDGINALLDKALAEYPAAEPDRAYLYGVLLDHIDRTGRMPKTFALEPKEPA